MAFYDRDRNFISKVHAGWQREQAAFEEKEAAKKPGTPKKAADIQSLGGELASYHLGFLMHADAQRVIVELDKLWSTPGDKVAHNEWMMNVFWQASALTELGRPDFAARGSSPTAMVYANAGKRTRTLIAWNPTAKPQSVVFFEGARPIGQLNVAPHSIASALAVKQ